MYVKNIKGDKNMNVFLGMISILTIAFFMLAIVASIVYAINALFLYKIAKANGMENRWQAWIPIVNTFYLGEIAACVDKNPAFKNNYFTKIIMGTVLYLLGLIIEVPFVSIIGILLIVGFELMAYYKIFNEYVPDLAVLFTIFMFINPFGTIIQIIFMVNEKWYCRDKEFNTDYYYKTEYEERKSEQDLGGNPYQE